MLATLALLLSLPPDPLRACAWVRAENDGAGAGFVVDAEKRLLVTCRHVVAERKKVDVFFPWFRGGELVTDRREYLGNRALLRDAGLLVVGEVLKTADESDLALVQLESLPPGTPAVTLSARAPRPGEVLRVIGHRLDLDTLWNVTAGPLRASGALADGYFWRGKKLAAGADVIVGQLPTEEGDSGGPVFDSRGAVVGLASALRRQCPLAAVVISAAEIRTFLDFPNPPAPKPDTTNVADALTAATVWVKPAATDLSLAGALIERDLVLTCARGLTAGERVGVALPLRDGARWTGERAAYRDPIALHAAGRWRSGTVLARDPGRDLALIKLDAACEGMTPLKLAPELPKPGDAVHAVSHPGGLEFAWVYAGGAVRQRGHVALDAGERAPRVAALVLQLPAQAGSPGGPVANAKGELVGVLSAREGAQMVGYCATADEIRLFLDVALTNRPPKTVTGLLARLEARPREYLSALARGLAARAETHRAAGRTADATRDADVALSLDPACVVARLVRAKLNPDDALAELDAAVEKGGFDRSALLLRAEQAVHTKDFRKARGDLERVLGVFPADAEARQRLAGAHLGLGDDAKAAAAIADALRIDPKRLASIASDLLSQADALEQKYPGAPGIAADWLQKALTAAAKHCDSKSIAAALTAASAAKTDADRLRVLRAGLKALR
jgi:S1-C subfamily serine protease